MKEIKVKDLKVGDVFIHIDTYLEVVAEGKEHGVYMLLMVKYIIAPTNLYFIGYRPYLLPPDKLVLLCESIE